MTGAREKVFCTSHDIEQRAKIGDYGLSESGMFEIRNLHEWTLEIPSA